MKFLYFIFVPLTAALAPTAIPTVAPVLNLVFSCFIFEVEADGNAIALGSTYFSIKVVLEGFVTFNITNERVGSLAESLPKTINMVSLLTETAK